MQETWVQSLDREDGNGYPLQWGENPVDRGAWRATFYEVAKSWTRLSNGFFPPLGSSRASWQLGTLSFPWPSLHNWSVAMAAPYTTHTVQSEGNSGEKGPFPPVLSIRQSIFPSHLLQISLIFHTVGWPKCSFGFFHNILRKTQMNILANQQYWLCPTLAQLVTQKQALRKLT